MIKSFNKGISTFLFSMVICLIKKNLKERKKVDNYSNDDNNYHQNNYDNYKNIENNNNNNNSDNSDNNKIILYIFNKYLV